MPIREVESMDFYQWTKLLELLVSFLFSKNVFYFSFERSPESLSIVLIASPTAFQSVAVLEAARSKA